MDMYYTYAHMHARIYIYIYIYIYTYIYTQYDIDYIFPNSDFLDFYVLLQLIDTVCNQLYNFYRSREIELQRFTLQFLPTLIYIYLNSAAHGDIKVKLFFR